MLENVLMKAEIIERFNELRKLEQEQPDMQELPIFTRTEINNKALADFNFFKTPD
jgi:phage regulator Rha-like protein